MLVLEGGDGSSARPDPRYEIRIPENTVAIKNAKHWICNEV